MADGLEFVGRAVEENSFCPSLPKMSLKRGEQFRKLGSSLFDSLKGHPESGIATRKQPSNASVVSTRGRRTQAAEWQAASKQAKSKNDEQFK
jgi:hypothetical protein